MNPVTDAWELAKRHWGVTLLGVWLPLTGALYLGGHQWGAIVTLSLATLSYYGMAKIEAIEKAEQSNTKG